MAEVKKRYFTESEMKEMGEETVKLIRSRVKPRIKVLAKNKQAAEEAKAETANV